MKRPLEQGLLYTLKHNFKANSVFLEKIQHRKSNSGFGWDDAAKMPTAPPDVWNRYIEAKAKEFRTKSLKNYGESDEMFSGKIAQENSQFQLL